ncbi:unnamed protein product [Microthlaspi erraticum]|uniref:Uncharacterized protein n=1 Tax=Microthlaspi erraticum TaxID=1685480 RepID=A0A6D2IRB5_9BRAS|nr:unnamed protein product [Microthlaspi erraticum]
MQMHERYEMHQWHEKYQKHMRMRCNRSTIRNRRWMSKALMPKKTIVMQGSTEIGRRSSSDLKNVEIVDKSASTNHQALNRLLDNAMISIKMSRTIIMFKQATNADEIEAK